MEEVVERASEVFSAQDILELASCVNQTAIEPMAHRWFLKTNDAAGLPDCLVAPRFAVTPSLKIPVPQDAAYYEVYVTVIYQLGWFNHIRVGYPGAAYPVTVLDPAYCGRPVARYLEGRTDYQYRMYALTVPAAASFIEISKGEEVEASLVSVEFRPTDSPGDALPDERPEIIGIFDFGILASETLQAYDQSSVDDFYRQMRDLGFSDVYHQVYAGYALWSELAKCHRDIPLGHRPYANWNEPSYLIQGGEKGSWQREIDAVHEAGMKMTASFRINNEWLADWAKVHWNNETPAIASVFSIEHPEFWMTYKSGGRYGSGLDFAFPEVREYRHEIIAEWCDKFRDFDGICIDVYRHPVMVSYPEHLVQAFKEQTGVDVRRVEPVDEDTMLPEWLRFRAGSFTEFMRMVHASIRERYGDSVRISARVANSFERALLDGCELDVWFDDGLVDTVVLQHREGSNPLDLDSRGLTERAHQHGVKVVHFLGCNHGIDFPDDTILASPRRELLRNWASWGSDGFGFYEAERVVRDGRWLRDMPSVLKQWNQSRSRNV